MRRALVVLLSVIVAACGSTTAGPRQGSPATSARLAPGPATSTAPTPAATTTVPGPSAYDQLAPFVRAAGASDTQLRKAAMLINGAGPPWTLPLPAETRSAVRGAYDSLQPAGAAIPAGLPLNLLHRAVMVYSELASRVFAIRWFGGEEAPYAGPAEQAELLRALANGAPAAARFDSDLAGLVAAARAAPPVSVAPPTSRQAADVGLLVQWATGLNGGCASTGGAIVYTLPSIVWSPRADGDGTIDGVAFRARLVDGAWQLRILAC